MRTDAALGRPSEHNVLSSRLRSFLYFHSFANPPYLFVHAIILPQACYLFSALCLYRVLGWFPVCIGSSDALKERTLPDSASHQYYLLNDSVYFTSSYRSYPDSFLSIPNVSEQMASLMKQII